MKSNTLIFITICGILFMSYTRDIKFQIEDEIIGKLLSKTEKKLVNKYNFRPIGTGLAMPGGVIKSIGLSFQITGPLKKEELRKILIDADQELLNSINESIEIRPYLEKYPFTLDNVEINLFVIDKRGAGVDDPEIAIASISHEELEYLVLAPDRVRTTMAEYTETFQEALKLLELESSSKEQQP